MVVLIIDRYIRLFVTGFMQVLYLGRAPRTKETLPDFLKWCRVTRHPLVFCGLTGSQRTPGFGVSQYKCTFKNYNNSIPRFAIDQTVVQGLKPTEPSTKHLNKV